MTRRDHDDLVPQEHPDRAALLALVSELEALPRESWSTLDVPAIAPPPEIVSAPPRSSAVRSRFARHRRRVLGGVVAAAAAAVVAIAVLGGSSTERAPTAVTALRAVEPGSGAAGRVEADTGRVRVALTGLAPVPVGQHYEAWSLADPESPQSLGAVRPDGDGAAAIDTVVDDPVGPVAVTLEPDSDDPAPSGAFVLRSS